jgi:hypothetical protein
MRQACRDLVQSVAERLTGRAAFLKVEPQALSTSLAVIVMAMSRDELGGCRWVAFQVGDNPAYILSGAGLEPFFSWQPSHQAGQPESSLPATAEPVMVAMGDIGHTGGVVVCTSGLGNLLSHMQARREVEAWWGGSTVPDLPEFAEQVSFIPPIGIFSPFASADAEVKSRAGDRTAICFWAR